ncbi:MAG: hypothetical protein AAF449_13570, partial [Myxococcota bacterium]
MCTLSIALSGVAAGCSESNGLQQLRGAIEVTPTDILLSTAPATVRSQATFTVRNTGSAAIVLQTPTIDGDKLFGLDGDPPQALAPSQSFELTVYAIAPAAGSYTADVVLASNASNEPNLRLPVRFTATDLPPCSDGNECTRDRFDPETSTCVHEFDDGRSCQPADRCIIDATCQLGVCLGQQKKCSDKSICTQDVCRQTDGQCLFVPDEKACDDGNPCTADLCTNEGCAHAPLANGVACDDGDLCTTEDTCFGGACVGIGEPDGSSCDDGDSCTVNDTCLAGVCTGNSIIEPTAEGAVVFEYPLIEWPTGAFLHRRHVSMSDDGIFYGLDHLTQPGNRGLIHVIFAFNQCGTPV